MANFFDQFETEQKSEPAENFFDQFDSAKKPEAGNFFDKFDAPKKKAEPTESGGFTGSFMEALKERFATAVPAAKLYTGAGNQEAATRELLKAQQDSENAFKQTEFGEIGKAFKEGHFGDALGMTLDKFKEVAGSSLGSMAPAMVAGAGDGRAHV